MNNASRIWPRPPADGKVQRLWLNDLAGLELLEQKGPVLTDKVTVHIVFGSRKHLLTAGQGAVIRGLVCTGIIESVKQVAAISADYGDVPLGLQVEVCEQ